MLFVSIYFHHGMECRSSFHLASADFDRQILVLKPLFGILNPTASTVNPMTIQWNPQLVLPRCQCLSDSHDSVRCVKLPRVDTTQWSRFFENLFCARTSLKAFEIKNVHSGLDCRRMSWGTFECPLRFSKKSWMFFRCI